MWTLPDKGEGQNDVQSILFQEYLDVLVSAVNGVDAVLSGGAVTAQGSPNMTVAVAKAGVLTNDVLKPVGGVNVSIGKADATNPRLDLVVVDAAGRVVVRQGVSAANPMPPFRQRNDVALASIYVPANDTTIGSDQITDLRIIPVQPIVIATLAQAVAVFGVSAITTYFSVTLPSGLLLSGRILNVRIGGSYGNAVSCDPIFTIAYGGTTLWSDTQGALTADNDQGSWYLDFDLTAQANNDQALAGVMVFQTPGLKTVPTTGRAGDLAVVTHVALPIAGSAAVDSDAADRTLTVQATMGGVNGSDFMVAEFAQATLS